MSLSEFPRETKLESISDLAVNEAFSGPKIRYTVASDTVIPLNPYNGSDSEILKFCDDIDGSKYTERLELKAGDEFYLTTPTAHQIKTDEPLNTFAYIAKYPSDTGHGGPHKIADLSKFSVEIIVE
jgi:hypothetical protein